MSKYPQDEIIHTLTADDPDDGGDLCLKVLTGAGEVILLQTRQHTDRSTPPFPPNVRNKEHTLL